MPPEDLRLLFAHQSVGTDLLDGLRTSAPDLRIIEIGDDSVNASAGGIIHCLIGRNHDPYSKIAEFETILLDNGSSYDLALLKFCYVDISRDTDVSKLFAAYSAMAERVSATLPALRLFHATVPLRHIQLGIRSYARLIGGIPIDAVEDNLQREKYNELVRSRWVDTDTVFDIAKAESTLPDGSSSHIRYRRSRVAMLYNGYSLDGGHLNRNGKAAIARLFMRTFNLTTGTK